MLNYFSLLINYGVNTKSIIRTVLYFYTKKYYNLRLLLFITHISHIIDLLFIKKKKIFILFLFFYAHYCKLRKIVFTHRYN